MKYLVISPRSPHLQNPMGQRVFFLTREIALRNEVDFFCCLPNGNQPDMAAFCSRAQCGRNAAIVPEEIRVALQGFIQNRAYDVVLLFGMSTWYLVQFCFADRSNIVVDLACEEGICGGDRWQTGYAHRGNSVLPWKRARIGRALHEPGGQIAAQIVCSEGELSVAEGAGNSRHTIVIPNGIDSQASKIQGKTFYNWEFRGMMLHEEMRALFDETHPGEEPESTVLLGLPFHDVTMDEALLACARTIRIGRPSYLATANLDFATQAYRNGKLHRILCNAKLVLCDGMPPVWISSWFGASLRARVTGADLVPKLLELCAQRGWRVYFLGSDPASLERTKKILKRQLPTLQMVGCCSPPMGQIEDWDNDRIVAEIRNARPHLLLVAFGCPKQEKWISAFHQQIGVPLSIGIGASLDFICGKQKRAPEWMQKSGLEWFFRLITNPRRLLKRYWGDFLFFVGVTGHHLHVLRSMWVDVKATETHGSYIKSKKNHLRHPNNPTPMGKVTR